MFTVQPGAMFPWHWHPGMVVVNVTSGELGYVSAMDCVERPYAADEAFVDPGHGHIHTAFNRGVRASSPGGDLLRRQPAFYRTL
jgi:hypothetical protein